MAMVYLLTFTVLYYSYMCNPPAATSVMVAVGAVKLIMDPSQLGSLQQTTDYLVLPPRAPSEGIGGHAPSCMHAYGHAVFDL